MKSKTIGEAVVTLTADTTLLEAGIERAQHLIDEFRRRNADVLKIMALTHEPEDYVVSSDGISSEQVV